MGIILGIDLGGSTTKIVAFDEKQKLLAARQIRASDQITSLYGSIGQLLHTSHIPLDRIARIVLSGVGASYVDRDIFDIPTVKVTEFDAIGLGGLYLSGLEEALVVSMGTGTAFVRASAAHGMEHIGGSGVGGGTLLGLASRLVGQGDIRAVAALAENGHLDHVDLSIGDISRSRISSLAPTVTASNFGKLDHAATDSDLALGLVNTVFQTVGIMAAFACRNTSIQDVVVTGSLASLKQGQQILDAVGALYGLRFFVPKEAPFATAMGAALLHFRQQESQ